MGAEEVLRRAVEPALRKLAGHKVQRLLGFWVMVNTAGDFKRLLDQRWIAESGAYVQRREFRQVFGCEPEEFLPEVGALLRPSHVEDADGPRRIVKRPS